MWSVYELVDGEAWLRARRRRKLVKSFLWPVGALIVAVTFYPDSSKRLPYLRTLTLTQPFAQTIDSAHLWIRGLWERLM